MLPILQMDADCSGTMLFEKTHTIESSRREMTNVEVDPEAGRHREAFFKTLRRRDLVGVVEVRMIVHSNRDLMPRCEFDSALRHAERS